MARVIEESEEETRRRLSSSGDGDLAKVALEAVSTGARLPANGDDVAGVAARQAMDNHGALDAQVVRSDAAGDGGDDGNAGYNFLVESQI